jgi:hypothetical protein
MGGLRKKGPARRLKKRARPRVIWESRPCAFANPERRASGRKDKRQFPTAAAAFIALQIMAMKGKADREVHVFRCPGGDHFHLGHRRKIRNTGAAA